MLVLLFAKLNNIFLDTLIQKMFFEMMKINNSQGDLIDILAKKEALVNVCASTQWTK